MPIYWQAEKNAEKVSQASIETHKQDDSAYVKYVIQFGNKKNTV